ncbi:hypothetical protein N8I77_003350 [Diaporthe amygdali]|uniref:Uncharacterized protein n=1 Tax=Phomopsis amygdali TaxID=1214568 RepID=A0AAD9SJR6_PHOAM|nr:hypothetical protein N8I77_003350 [Diaporthe amygdali]
MSVVPLLVLDAFLLANNINESEVLCSGFPPFYDEDSDQVTTLLRNKVGSGDAKTRVFVPARMSYKRATSGYIAYDWTVVFAQRRFDAGDLAEHPPVGFEELRKEVLSYANASDGAESLADDPRYQNALYVVITDERTYIPPEMLQRMKLICLRYRRICKSN